jgi:hypothetical protein
LVRINGRFVDSFSIRSFISLIYSFQLPIQVHPELSIGLREKMGSRVRGLPSGKATRSSLTEWWWWINSSHGCIQTLLLNSLLLYL